ncbi:MAG: permease-like cell division protein FtsX [Eggerthellales bacterium]|nr:permease-like cell division protein FtsX [Eggerthellales bacterium]
MSSLLYFFKESLIGFTRNLSTTLGSIITIFLSLLIIGVFSVAGVVIDDTISDVEDKVAITCYVSDEASDADIQAAMNTFEGFEGVDSVTFTTKDQALENFRASTSSEEMLAQLDGMNPLPASIEVNLVEAQGVDAVAQAITDDPGFQAICDNPENPAESVHYGQETVEKLLTLTKYIRYIGIGFIALLIVIALIFINNTIRLSILARNKEISIMRLVGASNGFIRGPFLMESSVHAVIGALLAIGCIEMVRRFGLPAITENLAWLSVDVSGQVYLIIYAALLVSGLIIAAIGSAFAMRRYLKV